MDKSIIKHGLSRRFSIALTGVVSLVILVFSIIAVVHNNTKIETRLGQKLLRTSKLAETSLPSAVWQVDYESMADLLDAIFTDETIVHASITFEEETLAKKGRPPFDQSPFSFFKASSQFMVNTVEIHKAGKKIGNFHIAISREKTNKEFLLNLLGIAVFTLIVIAAISITCIVLTRRYIFDPLLKLEKSTGMIANGDLEASIVVAHDDEVGWLARSIVNMRDAIKEKIKQLEQAEKKYRNIFDNALEGIFQAFPDGRLMNVNHSAASILGYDSPADMISSINDVTSNLYAYARDHGHFLRTLNKTGILIGFEAQYLCKDGRVIWMSVNARQIKDATGEIEYYEGSFLDITQRKQAQQDLQESLGRYRLLLEASPIPIAVYDPEGRVSYVNPAFVDTFGWSMAELMGRRPDFVPSHEAAKTGQAIKRTLKGERVSIQSQRLTREQKVLDVLINAALYTDHSGKPQGIIVTFRDFTELKQAERDLSKHRDHLEQLVEERTQELTQANQRLSEEIIEHKATETALMDSKERFRQLAEMLPETVFEMDLFSNFTFRNKASFTTFGYESHIEEAPGNALDSIVPEDHQRVIENCAKILEGEPSMGNEYRAIRRDGSIFPIMIYTNALMEDGQAIGYRGILLDISERKEMEEALRLAKESADHANKTKSEFLASMSHEIRTPMNAILGMGDLLLESNLTPEQKRYVQILTQSGENLLDIINDILDLSKVEAGQLALESMGFNLQELIDQSCEMMAVKAHSKGLELLSRTKAQTPIHLSGDPARLRQILINLMGNAIKFTHAGEVVLEIVGKDPLSWENKNRVCLEFSVRDTGIGISKEKQSYIFESFTQADSSTTREFGGTGLGLTICKRLVEMMGGEIWVESDPGHGCVFYFTAWFNMDTQPRTHRATPAAEIRGKQVLVVDDNATNRFILNETLSGWGANVSEAENGALALEAIEASEQANTPFDLILLDGKMPVLDGFETAKQINQRFNHMVHTVMLLTSDDSCSKIARAKKNGVPVCLIKPVKRRELKEAICAAMGQAISTGKNDHTPGKGELPSTERALNILIVEDGQENRILLRAYLKKSPHILDMAENGQLGVEKFMSASYDLVFMDMRMPVMDGYTATRTIRRWEEEQGRPRTFIVALTAHAMKEDRQKCLDAGCSDYLSKPVKKKDLLKMIEKG